MKNCIYWPGKQVYTFKLDDYLFGRSGLRVAKKIVARVLHCDTTQGKAVKPIFTDNTHGIFVSCACR